MSTAAHTGAGSSVNLHVIPPGESTPRHLVMAKEYLEVRGSTLDDFEQARCEVTPNASALDPMFPAAPALVFNFYDPLTGTPHTFTDEHGATRPFQRIRPLGVRGAKFLQPRASGTRVFYAAHPNVDWREICADASYGVVITEGETRSLAGAVCDLPVISITGVDCGQVDGALHPDLGAVNWRGRSAFLAFDSDVSRKAGPRLAIDRLAGLLRQHGAEVFETHIPPAADGSKQGLDDLLARHGAKTLSALIRSSETQPAVGVEAYEPPTALADLMATSYPPTEWAWDGFVLKGEVNLLFGDGGVGKSLLALHLAVNVAAGKPLFTSQTTHMPVIALFAEDGPAQVQQRVTTILIENGLDHKGALPIKLWCQPGGETALAQVDDTGVVKELPRLHALRAALAEIAAPALVVLDSMADLFALNESLRLPVNAALKQVLGGLCRDYGATVLVLAHPSKASMQDGTHYSGSTAYNNAVRQRLTLEFAKREPGDLSEGPPPRLLKVAKSNYGALAEKRLWYYGPTIVELPRASVSDDSRATAFHSAVVNAALSAARLNMPCNRRHINEQVFVEATKALGRRPTMKEVVRELEKASPDEAVYLNASSKRAAGFYPADMNEAVALALSTRRAKKPTGGG
jgi:hypothetical protein